MTINWTLWIILMEFNSCMARIHLDRETVRARLSRTDQTMDPCERMTWIKGLREKYKPIALTLDGFFFPRAPLETIYLKVDETATLNMASGSDMVVVCPKEARKANCNLTATWLRNQFEIYESDTGDEHITLAADNFELNFRPLASHHQGDYSCLVNGTAVGFMWLTVTDTSEILKKFTMIFMLPFAPIILMAIFRVFIMCIVINDEDDEERDERDERDLQDSKAVTKEILAKTLGVEGAMTEEGIHREKMRNEVAKAEEKAAFAAANMIDLPGFATARIREEDEDATHSVKHNIPEDEIPGKHAGLTVTPAILGLSDRGMGAFWAMDAKQTGYISSRAFQPQFRVDPANEGAKAASDHIRAYLTNEETRKQIQATGQKMVDQRPKYKAVLQDDEMENEELRKQIQRNEERKKNKRDK